MARINKKALKDAAIRSSVNLGVSLLSVGAIFAAVALTVSAGNYTITTGGHPAPEELSCTDGTQTLTIEEGEAVSPTRTNMGDDYYSVSRDNTETVTDGAITTTIDTEQEIRFYDKNNWVCTNPSGLVIDYKTMQPVPRATPN